MGAQYRIYWQTKSRVTISVRIRGRKTSEAISNICQNLNILNHNYYFPGYTRKGSRRFSPAFLGFKIPFKILKISQLCWWPLRASYLFIEKWRVNLSLTLTGGMILLSASMFSNYILLSLPIRINSVDLWITWWILIPENVLT